MVTWGLVGRGVHDGGRLVDEVERQDAPARRARTELPLQQRFPAALARVVDRYHDSFRWLVDDHVPPIMRDVGLSLKAHTFEGAHDPLAKHGIKGQRRLGRVRGPAERGCKTGVFTRAQKSVMDYRHLSNTGLYNNRVIKPVRQLCCVACLHRAWNILSDLIIIFDIYRSINLKL